MYNVSNKSSASLASKTNTSKSTTRAEPKKTEPLVDNPTSTTFVNTWNIKNFRRCFESPTPIDSPTFSHKFGGQTLQCKSKFYSSESYLGSLVIESQIEPRLKNWSVKLQCFLRDVDGVEIRLSRTSQTDGWQFKNAIQRSLLHKYIANDQLTIVIKIEVTLSSSQDTYDRVKDARLADDFASLLRAGTFSDVKLLVGERTIQAHKGILSCRSSVFAAMFLEERSDVVEIKNFGYDVINELMRFCYTGSVTKVSRELLRASDEFDVAGLKIVCEDAFARRLRVDNAPLMLILSDRCHAPTLRKKTMEFVAENLKEVAKVSDFKLLTRTMILEILKMWSSK